MSKRKNRQAERRHLRRVMNKIGDGLNFLRNGIMRVKYGSGMSASNLRDKIKDNE